MLSIKRVKERRGNKDILVFKCLKKNKMMKTKKIQMRILMKNKLKIKIKIKIVEEIHNK